MRNPRPSRATKVHLLRAGKRSTYCGRHASKTARDTLRKELTTCETCLMAAEAYERCYGAPSLDMDVIVGQLPARPAQ